MRPNSKNWKTYLLFLPGIFGIYLAGTSLQHTQYISTFNLLLVFNIILVLGVQANLIKKLTKAIRTKNVKLNTIMNVNALLPIAFFILYFFRSLYLSLLKNNENSTIEPLHLTDLKLSGNAFVFFTLYAIVNFLVVNSFLADKAIQKVSVSRTRIELRNSFHTPMKELTKASFYTIAVVSGFLIVNDIYQIF